MPLKYIVQPLQAVFFFFKRISTYVVHSWWQLFTKAPINFWCRQELNSESLIQPSEIFSIELTITYNLFKVPCDHVWPFYLTKHMQGWKQGMYRIFPIPRSRLTLASGHFFPYLILTGTYKDLPCPVIFNFDYILY